MDSCLAKAVGRWRSNAGVVVLEPLHTAVGHPGDFLSESAAAFEIDGVDSPRVKLLSDVSTAGC
ncbi:hypothetical protein [Salinigranum marinum]|uniref:hypothetical protein n=1 Tax=Salinigranum marinum TaxID=1515595 RepID=UPI002989AA57|nr:hypothetical protein [Salinigranum marinum]